MGLAQHCRLINSRDSLMQIQCPLPELFQLSKKTQPIHSFRSRNRRLSECRTLVLSELLVGLGPSVPQVTVSTMAFQVGQAAVRGGNSRQSLDLP